jgi:hypothetical protein
MEEVEILNHVEIHQESDTESSGNILYKTKAEERKITAGTPKN